MSSPYLVVAALFRNEAPFLAEWVSFHRIVGVDHFYLYDNGSTDHPETVLSPFLKEGCVTLRPWPVPFHERAQATAYTDCLNRVRGQARWLACIDIDEFLFSPQSFRLDSVLRAFEGQPGVVVHWQIYGSSGEERASERPVIARFARRAPTHWIRNRRVKSIADPDVAVEASMHYFVYRHDALAVTERKEPVRVGKRPRFQESPEAAVQSARAGGAAFRPVRRPSHLQPLNLLRPPPHQSLPGEVARGVLAESPTQEREETLRRLRLLCLSRPQRGV